LAAEVIYCRGVTRTRSPRFAGLSEASYQRSRAGVDCLRSVAETGPLQLSRHQDDHLVCSFEIPDRNCLQWCVTTIRSRSPNSHHPPSNTITYMENRTQAHNFTSSSEIATSILRNVWTFCQVTTQHPTPPFIAHVPRLAVFRCFLGRQRRDMDYW
jgi:hypothetical protein